MKFYVLHQSIGWLSTSVELDLPPILQLLLSMISTGICFFPARLGYFLQINLWTGGRQQRPWQMQALLSKLYA